jgi:hypothetical protein
MLPSLQTLKSNGEPNRSIDTVFVARDWRVVENAFNGPPKTSIPEYTELGIMVGPKMLRFAFDSNDKPHVDACNNLRADFLTNQAAMKVPDKARGVAPLGDVHLVAPVRFVKSRSEWSGYCLDVRRPPEDPADMYQQGSHQVDLIFSILSLRYGADTPMFSELEKWAQYGNVPSPPPFQISSKLFDRKSQTTVEFPNIKMFFQDVASNPTFVTPIKVSDQWSVDHGLIE